MNLAILLVVLFMWMIHWTVIMGAHSALFSIMLYNCMWSSWGNYRQMALAVGWKLLLISMCWCGLSLLLQTLQNDPPCDSRNRLCHTLGCECGRPYVVFHHIPGICATFVVVAQVVSCELLLLSLSLAPELISTTGTFWLLLCSCISWLWFQA